MSELRARLTFSNVVSLVALFLALGGSSYATIKLGKGAVKGRNIAKNAVSSPKVKNGSLKEKDFASGELPAGARGPQGLQGLRGPPGARGLSGASGAAGSALGFALIIKCPVACPATHGYMVDSPNSSHVDNDEFDHPATGIFCFYNNREFNGAAAVRLVSKNVVASVGQSSEAMFAQVDSAPLGTTNVKSYCGKTDDAYGPNHAVVRVFKSDGTAGDPDTIFVVFN